VRLDRKLGNNSTAALNVDTRLALRVLWIAVLLAVLTSHLRARDDFIIERYEIWRAAPSFADLVRLAFRRLVFIMRLPPQGSGHVAVFPGIKDDEEVTFEVSGGSYVALRRRFGCVGRAL
jgi:hypothetical protein